MEDPRKLRLLEWLTTLPAERVPPTKAGLADELGVAPRTLRDWQADEGFRQEQTARAMKISGGPEKTQMILAALEEQALDSTSSKQVQAAKLWLEATGTITPKGAAQPADQGSSGKRVRELSDEELEREIAKRAEDELAERRSRVA